jgi:hypothetical protein
LAILIKHGQFDDLKARLYNNICDIPQVNSALEGVEAKLMSKLIQGVMDRWFVPNKRNPDNLQLWKRTQEPEIYYIDLQKGGANDDIDKKNKLTKNKISDIAKSLKEDAQAKGLAERLEINPGLAPGNKRIKRVVSKQLRAEVKRTKVMAGDWKKLMNMADGIGRSQKHALRNMEI